MELEKFIREATRRPGVSGYESGVGEYIAECFRPLADSVRVDAMQNVIATVGDEGPRAFPCSAWKRGFSASLRFSPCV